MVHKTRDKKAQAAVFENVLIFTAGVAIFIMSYAVFMVYQNYFTAVGVDDQLLAVNEYIKSHIIVLAEKDANSSLTFRIPKAVSNEQYTIALTETGLNTTTMLTGTSIFSILSLGVQFERREIPSTRGRITLKKEGNKIILRM